MFKRIVVAAFFSVMTLALACPGHAAEKSSKPGATADKKTAGTGRFGGVNYKITYKVNAEILESSGSVTALDRADADYSTSGETNVDLGEIDGKHLFEMKHFRISAVFKPSTDLQDGNFVILESQFQLQGPLSLKGAGKQTIEMDFRTATRVMLGKTAVIMNGPGGRVEVTVEAVK